MKRRRKKRKRSKKNISPDYFTDIEFIFARFLSEHGIKYEHNKKISYFYPDFLLMKKIIVEVDGTYWHSSKRKKRYDKRRQRFLEGKGYTVIRLSDTEIYDNNLKSIFVDKLVKIRGRGGYHCTSEI